MSKTVYAAFSDAHRAESAAGALLDHGVPAKSISLVLSEEAKKQIEGSNGASSNPNPIVSGPGGATGNVDPLGNETRMSGANPLIPSQRPEANADVETVDELNPAQNDYPRSGSESPTELSSRPPNSKYDWNPDLDKKSYNADYEGTDSEKMDDEIRKENDRDRARVDPASYAKENDEGMVADRAAPANVETIDTQEYDADRAAKAGVTTTTIQDAATGAARGVGIGLGIGALAAAASIAIPGVGLILGGGALAAAVGGIAATAGAGAVAGGVVGYLKDQGVPADQIPVYQHAYEGGGAILTVSLENSGEANVSDILRKYGGANVEPYGGES